MVLKQRSVFQERNLVALVGVASSPGSNPNAAQGTRNHLQIQRYMMPLAHEDCQWLQYLTPGPKQAHNTPGGVSGAWRRLGRRNRT